MYPGSRQPLFDPCFPHRTGPPNYINQAKPTRYTPVLGQCVSLCIYNTKRVSIFECVRESETDREEEGLGRQAAWRRHCTNPPAPTQPSHSACVL